MGLPYPRDQTVALMTAGKAPPGLDLDQADAAGARRSGKLAWQPYQGESAAFVGYVELSQRTSLATEVQSSVARG